MNNKILISTIVATSFSIAACAPDTSVSTPTADTTAPTVTQITAVTTPTKTKTPSYTFNTNEAGTIVYGGDCSSATTSASIGNNTLSFYALENGTYSNCTVQVTDATNNTSTALLVSDFVIDWAAYPLNDTGQTTCGDHAYTDATAGYEVTGSGTHNNDLDCSSVGATQSTDGTDTDGDVVRAGQDAVYGRDIAHNDDTDGHAGFSFTKLDTNGDALADQTQNYATQPWVCVQDNVTGLIWEVKTDNGGLQDKDNTYTWYNSTGANDGGLAGTANGGTCAGGSGCDTEKYATDVNALNIGAGICGLNNWRIPSIQELVNITNLEDFFQVDVNYLPNPKIYNGTYWSSSSNAITNTQAFGLTYYFNNDHPKASSFYVRLVSGSQPATGNGCTINRNASNSITKPDSLYTNHGDGTVTDNDTGLMWQKCSLGLSDSDCLTGTELGYSWQAAVAEASTNSDSGYDDWRLPSRNELGSLLETACYQPSINHNLFPNTAYEYWSSSLSNLRGDYVWFVDFFLAFDYTRPKSDERSVRLVRNTD